MTIKGTESTGPPTPVRPEAKPAAAPIPNSSNICCRDRPDALCDGLSFPDFAT
jgi:hypothetical protein